jgi:hypothetical protein
MSDYEGLLALKCVQMSGRTMASTSSAAHPTTPALENRGRSFLHVSRDAGEDPDLVSVVEEGQLEDADQWCR